MVRIGDIVRFLNDVGGGRVVEIKNNNIAVVEDEDGFDIPMPINECVVIESTDIKETPKKNEVKVVRSSDEAPSTSETNPQSQTTSIQTKNGELIELSLAYTLDNPASIEKSEINVYAINESNYSIFVNYLTKDKEGKFFSRFAGILTPYSRKRIFTFNKSLFNNINRKFLVRAIPFKENNYFNLKTTFELEINLDPTALLKASSYKQNERIEFPAYIINVIKENEAAYVDFKDQILIKSLDELSNKYLKTITKKDKTPSLAQSIKSQNQTEVIDLHAQEVLETTAGMSNFDILSYQIGIFKQEMDKHYEKRHNKKLIFIHGKGNGVLRQALLKELKKSYPKAKSQDASFREYGFGATMIFL